MSSWTLLPRPFLSESWGLTAISLSPPRDHLRPQEPAPSPFSSHKTLLSASPGYTGSLHIIYKLFPRNNKHSLPARVTGAPMPFSMTDLPSPTPRSPGLLGDNLPQVIGIPLQSDHLILSVPLELRFSSDRRGPPTPSINLTSKMPYLGNSGSPSEWSDSSSLSKSRDIPSSPSG